MRIRTALVPLVLVATATGCAATGGASGAPDASSAPAASVPASQPGGGGGGGGEAGDACSLLGANEIVEVVGNAVEEGTGMTRSDCSWSSDPDETSVAVLLTSAGTPEICASALGADDSYQSLDEFAVPAFWTWVATSGGVGSVSVCNGDQMITVTVSAGLDDAADEATVRSQALELAEVVLARV